ncbi:FAD-dependent monooxygenase [Streptomonospora algeriensis]|uniref:FAD-dependent monooxygenase n=1 Tax=Streptomonospora algeriensis TaxID=995084 RepID=A0ABW3B9S4_9ACTN
MQQVETDVLIAGGGLVGLSAAVFAAHQGLRAVLVERRSGLSPHPRARGVNPRTMELLRGVGLEERVRSTGSGRALAGNSGVIAMESLTGRQFAELQDGYHADSGADYSDLSACGWCLCHQDELEPLLRDRAVELGADLRFGRELVSFDQDAGGVAALVSGEGERYRIHASYLVAADGAASGIRERLGIGFSGRQDMARFMNISFEADLREALGDRRFILSYVAAAGARCALLPVDNAHRWLLHVMDDTQGDVSAYDEARCVDLVRRAAGIPDLEVAVRGVVPWRASGLVADSFSSGRVHLVGDAAHVMPPSGAFGSNTGVSDAHNLAWKLALVVSGSADPSLLDTYGAERRPVALATVRQAVLRSQDRPRMMRGGEEGPPPEIRPDADVMFHYRYASSAVPGSAPIGETGVWDGADSGGPGTRAPHVWLGAEPSVSTVDLFGPGFTFLSAPEGAEWAVSARAEAERRGVRLDCRELGEGEPGAQAWASAYGVRAGGAVLVRPDGFVAWRAAGPPATGDPQEPGAVLAALLGHLRD